MRRAPHDFLTMSKMSWPPGAFCICNTSSTLFYYTMEGEVPILSHTVPVSSYLHRARFERQAAGLLCPFVVGVVKSIAIMSADWPPWKAYFILHVETFMMSSKVPPDSIVSQKCRVSTSPFVFQGVQANSARSLSLILFCCSCRGSHHHACTNPATE